MNNYTFSTLNDKDFEKLVCDLLNAKFNYKLQSFKSGKDGGVDLRYATPQNNNSIVIQVKHYAGSKFSNLKYELKNKELKKVKILKPDKYILVTSLPLKASEKDEIKKIMEPHILSSNDVLGQDDLNTYLGEFPNIEKQHFKLWFSSVAIIEGVLNNAIEGRARYRLEEISKKIPFYVVTDKLNDARQILNKRKLILITGQPGIGKSSLAELLLFEKASLDFKIYQVYNFREAEDVFSPLKEDKQLIFIDDFLGANYLEILNSDRTEIQITSFIERIINTPNKYLILTTRTVILNQAVKQSEKISHSTLAKEQFELKLTDYTKYEKALILYNHLYFKNVKANLYNSIVREKFYMDIIDHDNYTPRIIEFISDKPKIDNFNSQEYKEFIIEHLDNPKDIWRFSFENQIGYFERCLLLTLFTFEYGASEEQLILAFESRLQYEKEQNNQVIKSNQFEESLKILLNGFIISTILRADTGERRYTFINPSLTDFLINYISKSFSERKSIVSSIVISSQLRRFSETNLPDFFNKKIQLIIRDRIISSKISFNDLNANIPLAKKNGRILKALCEYCKLTDIDDALLGVFEKIDLEDLYLITDELRFVLNNILNCLKTCEFIKENFLEIVESIIGDNWNEDQAEEIPNLFLKYNYNFQEYQFTDRGQENLKLMIKEVIETLLDNFNSERRNDIEDFDEVFNFYEDIKNCEEKLFNKLLPYVTEYSSNVDFDEFFWDKKVIENRISNEKYRETLDTSNINQSHPSPSDVDKAIEELFSQ